MILDSQASPLVIVNVSDTDLSVLGTHITAGGSYVVKQADIVAWCQDAWLVALIEAGDCMLILYGLKLHYQNASKWLKKIAVGEAVVS